jgi:hypothetical protein
VWVLQKVAAVREGGRVREEGEREEDGVLECRRDRSGVENIESRNKNIEQSAREC